MISFLEAICKLQVEIIVNIRLLYRLYFWYRLFGLRYVCNFAVIILFMASVTKFVTIKVARDWTIKR